MQRCGLEDEEEYPGCRWGGNTPARGRSTYQPLVRMRLGPLSKERSPGVQDIVRKERQGIRGTGWQKRGTGLHFKGYQKSWKGFKMSEWWVYANNTRYVIYKATLIDWLILISLPSNKIGYLHYAYFTNEEVETEKLSGLLKIMHPVGGRTRTQTEERSGPKASALNTVLPQMITQDQTGIFKSSFWLPMGVLGAGCGEDEIRESI